MLMILLLSNPEYAKTIVINKFEIDNLSNIIKELFQKTVENIIIFWIIRSETKVID
ncbi:hypothetical protein [Malacoplasma iowae]|nr:hypothetical protein [Malacoplasma iowae]WPL36090.1 hypothetical protein QX180_01570 [Malacoplasma iowae]WPL38615.1 hypothetical protein QX181_03510 [Malacoplasma iowae]WPL40355.1 hypothetical protein QX183_02275 [Malacoplasma iowae]